MLEFLNPPTYPDWKQLRPKMHVPSQSDPAPDSEAFQGHVICEHGGLAPNMSARTRISQKVRQLLCYRSNDFSRLPGFHLAQDALSFVGYAI